MADSKHQTQQTKKHHYIPIFYLKKWNIHKNNSSKGAEIIEYQKIRGEVKERTLSPSATGYANQLYSLHSIDKIDAVEVDFLTKIDTNTSLVVNKMINYNEPLSEREKSIFITFMLTLIYRAPDRYKKSLRLYRDAMEPTRHLIHKHYPDYMEKSWEKFIENNYLNFFKKINNSRSLGNFIINMEWYTINYPCDVLLTSDHPIAKQQSAGIKNEDSYILLALSPRKLFVATNNYKTFEKLYKDRNQIFKYYNRTISEKAKTYIYSSRHFDLNIIGRWFGKNHPQNLGIYDDMREMEKELFAAIHQITRSTAEKFSKLQFH